MALQRGPQAMGGLQGQMAALRSATSYNEMMQRAKMQRSAQSSQLFNNLLQSGMQYGMQAQQLKARASLAREGWDQQNSMMETEYSLRADLDAQRAGYRSAEERLNPTPEGNAWRKDEALFKADLQSEILAAESEAKLGVLERFAERRGKAKATEQAAFDKIMRDPRMKEARDAMALKQQLQQKAKQQERVDAFDKAFITSDPRHWPEAFQPKVKELQKEQFNLYDPGNGMNNDANKGKGEIGLQAARKELRHKVVDLYKRSGGPKKLTPAQQFNERRVDGKDIGFPGTVWQPRKDGILQQIVPAQPEQPDPLIVEGPKPLFDDLTEKVLAPIRTEYNAAVAAQSPVAGTIVGRDPETGKGGGYSPMGLENYACKVNSARWPITNEHIRYALTKGGQSPEQTAQLMAKEGYDLREAKAMVSGVVQKIQQQQQQQQATQALMQQRAREQQGMASIVNPAGTQPAQMQAPGGGGPPAYFGMGPNMSPPARQQQMSPQQANEEIKSILGQYENPSMIPPRVREQLKRLRAHAVVR